jgi:hypothetical protein
MQLRNTPAERECKEKLVNRKEQQRKRKIKTRDYIEASLAAWLNIISSIMLWG